MFVFISAFSSAMGRLGQTWGWGTIVCTVKTVTLTMKVNTELELFVGEKEREGLKSTLLISLISTNFLLTCFAHHTLFFSYFYLNGDFSFFRFKVHFLSVFHSLLIHLMHFQVWNSAKFRAQSQSIQYSQNSLTRKKVFKLVVRNKAVSNSTNSSWKIVFKII